MTATDPEKPPISFQPKVQTRDLNVYYGAFHAVKNVNLTIPDRHVTALIGPSGCGKSTFLRALNRMHDLTPGARVQGKVLLDNSDIYDHAVDPVTIRHRVGMVFQRPNPFPQSIFDNVAYGPRLLGERRMPVLREIAQRGLMYVDDGTSPRSLAGQIAGANNLPFVKAGVVIDAVPTPNEIDRELAKLENIARDGGVAVGVATALPVSLAHIAKWAKSAESRGFLLVPISAAVVKPKAG